MKDGDRLQVRAIQVKSTEWLLRDKVKELKDEIVELECKLDVKKRLLTCYRKDFHAVFVERGELRDAVEKFQQLTLDQETEIVKLRMQIPQDGYR